DCLAEPQSGAGTDGGDGRETLLRAAAHQEGAVRAAQVLDEPLVALAVDLGVPAARGVIVKDQRALGVAPDEGALLAQRQGRADQWSGGDGQVCRTASPAGSPTASAAALGYGDLSCADLSCGAAATSLGSGRGSTLAGGAGLTAGDDARAVQVRAQHGHDGEHEEPQRGKQAEAKDGDGELRHQRSRQDRPAW